MNAYEFVQQQVNFTDKQLHSCLEGMPQTGWDHSVNEQAMSAYEIVGHLAECYHAYDVLMSTGNHYEDWGSFEVSDAPTEALTQMWNLRAKAIAHIGANNDPSQLEAANMYVANHDAYHVGQLATIRMAVDPEWNPYAMYE